MLRRWTCLGVLGLWIVACATASASAASASVELISRIAGDPPLANGPNGDTRNPSISADGRYVAFESDANNLETDGVNITVDIFVLDRESNTIENITAGAAVNSSRPSISADGRFVAFQSAAKNLVPEGTNGKTQIFVYDRDTAAIELLTVEGDDNSSLPRISADGRFVVFQSRASNLLVDRSTNADTVDIFVYDREADTTELLSAGGNDDSVLPSVSADGRFVAFASHASNLVVGDSNGELDIFVYDLLNDVTEQITGLASTRSTDPSISADGRFVAYESRPSNLSVIESSLSNDIYVYDRDTGVTEMLTREDSANDKNPSISADGRFVAFESEFLPSGDDDIVIYDRDNDSFEIPTIVGNGSSFAPAMSAGGRFIAIETNASNLVLGDINAAFDVLIFDQSTRDFARVPKNVAFEVAGGNHQSSAPSVSEDGRFVAFESLANDLVADDLNEFISDIFVFDANTNSNELITADANGASRNPSINADGGVIAFESDADNIALDDTNGYTDIFRYDRATASSRSLTAGGNADSINASISADGRAVAFESQANNLVLEDANGRTTDIFVYNQQTASIELLTVGGNGDSVTPAISADGRFVAFTSQANNLVTSESVPGPDDTNELFNLFVHDRVMGTTELLTADADNSSFQPSISANGRFVAFSSDATNLVDEDLNGGGQDIFVHDRNAGTTRLLTPGGDFGSFGPSISADGQLIAFTSDARNLVAVDPTVDADILVFDQNTDTIQSITTGADGDSQAASISGDGRRIAFVSLALNLANDGTHNLSDVFISSASDRPVADSLITTTREDVPVALTLTGSDPNNDALTFEVVDVPVNGELSGAAPDFIYTPNPDYFGADSFSFSVNDGGETSEPATVSVTITSVNDAPVVAGSADITTPEDKPVAIELEATDVEDDSLNYAVVSEPANGSLSGIPPNLIYSPAANFSGSDEFSFTVSDGELTSEAVAINLRVTPASDAPVALPQSLTTLVDMPLAITLMGNDPDEDSLTFVVVGLPTNGTLSGSLPDLLYTPREGFAGTDSFSFSVSDGTSTSRLAKVRVSVSTPLASPIPGPGNLAPVANPQSITVPMQTSVSILLGGTDADNDTLTFSFVTLPENGGLGGVAPNLVYTPDANYVGSDSFTFTVSDVEHTSDPATVAISVVDGTIELLSAVLPASRSVEVGATATAFATLINAGSVDAQACRPQLPDSQAMAFFYQTSDVISNQTVGQPNLPVNIPAGASQSFVFGITPNEELSAVDVALVFECANATAAASFVGLNTLLLSASNTPVADLIALAATVTDNGVMELVNNDGFFTTATVNVGSAATISVSADTGEATLPIALSLCQTDPATSECINPTLPTTASVIVDIAEGESPTFAVFGSASESIALDPANSRVFLRFSDELGGVRGATSVAVQSVP